MTCKRQSTAVLADYIQLEVQRVITLKDSCALNYNYRHKNKLLGGNTVSDCVKSHYSNSL